MPVRLKNTSLGGIVQQDHNEPVLCRLHSTQQSPANNYTTTGIQELEPKTAVCGGRPINAQRASLPRKQKQTKKYHLLQSR